jgi:hypothetical protein
VSDRKLEHLKTAPTTGKEEGGIKRKKRRVATVLRKGYNTKS